MWKYLLFEVIMYKTSYAFFFFLSCFKEGTPLCFFFFSVCDILVFRESDRSLGKPRECWICIFSSAGFRIWFRSLLKCYLLGVTHTSLLSTFHTSARTSVSHGSLWRTELQARGPRTGKGVQEGAAAGVLGLLGGMSVRAVPTLVTSAAKPPEFHLESVLVAAEISAVVTSTC